jgi:ABC transporter substrate binding protein
LTVLRARWRLRGVKPEDIPVEEPAKFDLVVNLKTAKAIALTMPESLLTRADEVCRPAVVRRQLKRRHVLAFFEKLSPCLVGIDACAS